MNYYLHINYSTQPRSPLFGKDYIVYEPIAISMVADDGRQYYAVSKELNPVLCSDDEQEQYLKPIIEDFVIGLQKTHPHTHNKMLDKLDNKTLSYQFKVVQKYAGVHLHKIEQQIFNFINPEPVYHINAYNNAQIHDPSSALHAYFKTHNVKQVHQAYYAHPTFISYDGVGAHVGMQSIFAADMPIGFPPFTHNLQQTLHEVNQSHNMELSLYKNYPTLPTKNCVKQNALYAKNLHNFLLNLTNKKLSVPAPCLQAPQ